MAWALQCKLCTINEECAEQVAKNNSLPKMGDSLLVPGATLLMIKHFNSINGL